MNASCPTSASHGPLEPRDPSRQTPEQTWCGEWWDCPEMGCHSSALIPSTALNATIEVTR